MSAYVVKDSGQRVEFDTGAVRDVTTGKGRFDLIPLGIMGEVIETFDSLVKEGKTGQCSYSFFLARCEQFLQGAPHTLMIYAAVDVLHMGASVGIGVQETVLRFAKLMENGAHKYGERNWELGQPLSRYIDSAIRHLTQWHMAESGEFPELAEEDHYAAVFFNLCGAIYCWRGIYQNKTLPKLLDDRPEEINGA